MQLQKQKQMKPANSLSPSALSRRTLVKNLFACSAATTLGGASLWANAQGNKSAAGTRAITIAHIADMSAAQIDVSKDFLIGARAAWADINAKGGLRGTPVQHLVLETDGSRAGLNRTIDLLRSMPQCVAAFGTVGHLAAEQTAELLSKEVPDLAHIAPWLQSTDSEVPDSSFPIFAGRREQIQHALKSLTSMGIEQVGVVFATAADRAASLPELERMGRSMALRPVMLPVQTDLQRLGQSLDASSPRVILFIGGTPELMALAQGIGKQAQQRYVVALADVNVQTLQQSGLSRHVAVIATQVVPLVNSQAPVVRLYRDTMTRLYDEPASPQSLAGFIAARYTFEALRQIDGTVSRASLMSTLQQRRTMDLGGFQITTTNNRRSGSYVTQSMLASDGRFIG
jgi:ABC-type branched-subunit amino acid transport system substrate-binding protein